MARTYPRSTNHLPGTWNLLIAREKKSATFTCLLCGEVGTLEDHEIEPDGTVSPSVVCPTPDCEFHEWIQLEGWNNGQPVNQQPAT